LNINELHRRACDGEKSAEAALFERLSVSFRVFAQQRIGNRDDAEEIVQEALVTILGKYREIEFTSSFSAWAHRVLINKTLDYHKRKGRQDHVFVTSSQEASHAGSPGIDPALQARLRSCLQAVLKVNRRYGRILALHYQGYTTPEICERLDITTNHFYVILSRARSMLEACLEEGNVS
jgi:RNA polymerase sigma factor (sigma-70 family)